MSSHSKVDKISFAGLLIALGIIYGDIGTSPLYVFKAIVGTNSISSDLILGSLSCIIWTLTLQTTIKYVILTLRADNNGEGGIFSLYALIRRYGKFMVYPAMVGGVALIADGIITPPISVVSAVEGLQLLPGMHGISDNTIVIIVVFILSILFFAQQFGTEYIGKAFGPIMFIWFLLLAILGIQHIQDNFNILKAFNPVYAMRLLTSGGGKGFWILGAVFLCTTGAEALYSDLGHCGRRNIRLTWLFVKSCLILNYLGQGAWLLNQEGKNIDFSTINPFYSLMSPSFLVIGILIATMAAIIASQALISGSFTLIGEAMRLNLWPKLKIVFPTKEKGQIYIPYINYLLWAGCICVVFYFRKSSNMEAAYGLSICVCMIMTSILFAYYLRVKRFAWVYVGLYLLVYLSIEFSFLIANLVKFFHGGYITLIVGSLLFVVTFVWYRARKIKNRYVEFAELETYLAPLEQLSRDQGVPKYATHLAYMASANIPNQIEYKILHSIFNRKPKRADIYWFVHLDTLDQPYGQSYKVITYKKNDVYRIDFKIGFRVQPRVDLFFRQVIEDLKKTEEISFDNKYETVLNKNIIGDYRFIVIEKFLSNDNELPFFERLVMRVYFLLRHANISEEKSFGLDANNVRVEKFPLVISTLSCDTSLIRKT